MKTYKENLKNIIETKLSYVAKESLILWFEKFYGGEEKTILPDTKHSAEGLKILATPISDINKDIESFYATILTSLKSYPKNKAVIAAHLKELLTYVVNFYGSSIDFSKLEPYTIKEKKERQLALLKYLHSGNKRREDIAQRFGISEQTLSNDLNSLMNDFEFLGFKIEMSNIEYSKNTYHSKVNPLFYAANMSEIYALTIGLKYLSKGTPFEHALNPIADKLYQQLSDYAKEVIDTQSRETGITFSGQEMKFLSTADFYNDKNLAFTYFLKDTMQCKVTYYNSTTFEEKILIGTLHLPNNEKNSTGKIILNNGTEDIPIDVNRIRRIEKID